MASNKMMMKVYGTDELIYKFRRMNLMAQGQALDIAAQAGAEVIRSETSTLAPKDSGNLARSYHTAKE